MKGRKHRASGGETGVDEWKEDEKMKPERYNKSRVEDEAEERKHGGRAKGHPKDCKCKECRGGRVERKHGGMVHGEHAHHHMGRKPRKSGGRASSDMNPFSSARKGTPPAGHHVAEED